MGARDGIRLEYIQPGNPYQNPYVKQFNRTERYEWLSQYYWSNLAEVQDFATKWMWSYNHDRTNMALGGFTPKQRWPWLYDVSTSATPAKGEDYRVTCQTLISDLNCYFATYPAKPSLIIKYNLFTPSV